MIQIFNPFASKGDLISKNGKYNLSKICTYAVIEDKLNGVFNLEARIRILKGYDAKVYDFIQEDNILKVKDEYGYEFFRIRGVTKSIKDISIKAIQISLSEFMNLWVNDSRPTEQTGAGALRVLQLATGDTDFNFSSDITNKATSYFMDMSLYDAIYTAENSFLKRWGGEITRRGFNFSINANAGIDRGFQIRSRKNLQGFEAETNLDKLCTRIVAKGFDTLRLNEFVDSPLINSYSKPFTKVIKYDDVTVKNESSEEGFDTVELAQAELKKRALEEFSINNIDKLKAYYRINFLELRQTEEYKDFSIAEYSQLGDVVSVFEETNNIDVKVKVVGRKWDVMKQRRVETELSNYDIDAKPVRINDLLQELGKYAQGGSSALSDYITAMMEAGLSNSYAIHRKNETLYMDTNDINTATEVFRLNKNGLGFSSTGYYGKYVYGFTRDGKINADLIQVGTLTAILLKSLDGQNWIDLSTGEVNFNKGKINGRNLEIDLDTGFLKSTYSDGNDTFEIKLGDGILRSNFALDITADANVWISQVSNITREVGCSIFLGKTVCSLSGKHTSLGSIAEEGTTTRIYGKTVTINDRDYTSQLANIENALLMQEGII